MSHMISSDARGLFIPVESGPMIRLTNDRVYSRSTPWHSLGTVWEHGLSIYNTERPYGLSAYTVIDAPVFMKDGERYENLGTYADVEAFLADGGQIIYDLDTELQPVFVNIGGQEIMTEYAMIINNGTRQQLVGKADRAHWVPDPNIIKPVRSGLTSETQWLTYNPEGQPYTRSANYEVVTPREVFRMMDEILYNETGIHMKAHSAGALGEGGSMGVWASIPLPKWHGDVMRAIDTDVESYLTFFNDPKGTMYVIETDILTVCNNTWIAALANATRRLKVDHQLGATERMREALEGVWTANKEGQQMVQEVMMHLRDTRVEREQVQLAAQAMFPLPGRPDAELVGVRSLDVRTAEWERTATRALYMREAYMELYDDPTRAREELGVEIGVSKELEGTAFAAAQVGTFMQSYYPSTSADYEIREWMKGKRLAATNGALSALMSGGDLEVAIDSSDHSYTVPVAGIGYPQGILDEYAGEFAAAKESEGIFSPLQTSLN